MRLPLKNVKGIDVLTKQSRKVLPFQVAVGQVTESVDSNTRQVKVLKMEMNDYLKMYFNKSFMTLTLDENGESKKGDIVLIRKLVKPPTQTKLFGIHKILFDVDNLVDPITGQRVSEESEILAKYLESISESSEQQQQQKSE